jgi:predicted XRE-type DNA-binding protein
MLKALERDEFIHVSQIEHWKSQTDLWKKELIELKIGKQIQSSKVMDRDKYNRMIRYRGMGLTQRETAKLLDISRDAVQHFERIARQYELKLVSGGAA